MEATIKEITPIIKLIAPSIPFIVMGMFIYHFFRR